jgi:hypothetical protein
MSPTPLNAPPRSGFAAAAVAAVLLSLAAAGCSRVLTFERSLARQVAVNGCIDRCQTTKDQCDADARWDYQQCQAGYAAKQRDYLWCNNKRPEPCSYPWWSCSENLYGYCTNRYWECHDACLRRR